MNVSVDVKKCGEQTVIKVAGEIDAYTAPRLKESIYPLSLKEKCNLLVDLTNVTYMDSTGLGVLVGTFKNVKKNEGHFSITGLSERLHRLFSITGLSEIMDINSDKKGVAE